MAKFCNKCGRPLINNEPCNCTRYMPKFCNKCGKPIINNEPCNCTRYTPKFCNKCGKPIINNEPCSCGKKLVVNYTNNVVKNKPAASLKKILPLVIVPVVVVASVAVSAITNNKNHNPETDVLNSVSESYTEMHTDNEKNTAESEKSIQTEKKNNIEADDKNTKSDNKKINYLWYLKPTIQADELYVYDFESVNCSYNSYKENDVYDWFAVIKKDGLYNIADYNGKQYLTEKYTHYFEHACVGIMFDKTNGEEVTGDYTRDYNEGNKYNHEEADKNLTIWYNSDIKKIEFVKGGSSKQGHGGKLQVIYTFENNGIVYHDCGLDFDDYPNSLNNEYYDENYSPAALNEYNKSNALIITDTNSNKFGIAFNNQMVVPCSYKKTYENGDYIWLGNDDNWELYNSKGKKVLDFICNSVNINANMVSSDFNNFICSDGSVLKDSSNDCIPFLPTENIIAAYTSDGCAYFDTNGTQLTSYGDFEEIRPVHNNLAWVKKDGQWGVIQFKGKKNTYLTPEIAEKDYAVTTENKETQKVEKKETQKIENKEVQKNDGWKNAYKNKLSELQDGSDIRYNIYDMDNDGVPELFVAIGPYNMAGVLIYTYYDNHVVDLSGENAAYGSMGTIELFKDSGELVASRLNMGYYSCALYKKVGNRLELIVSYLDDSGAAENNITYQINTQEVSLNEYINSYDSYFKNKEMLVLGIYYGYNLNDTSLIDSYTTNENSLSLQGDVYTSEGLQNDIQSGIYDDYSSDLDNGNSDTFVWGTVQTDDGDELFVRSSPEIINSPGKGNKFDCFPNGTVLSIDMSKSVDNWYYVTGTGLSGHTATGYVSKDFVVIE